MAKDRRAEMDKKLGIGKAPTPEEEDAYFSGLRYEDLKPSKEGEDYLASIWGLEQP